MFVKDFVDIRSLILDGLKIPVTCDYIRLLLPMVSGVASGTAGIIFLSRSRDFALFTMLARLLMLIAPRDADECGRYFSGEST